MYVFDNQLPTITCNGCGVCCSEIGVPPFVRHEIYDLPVDLRDEVLAYEKNEPEREDSMKPCYWWNPETKRCMNYDNRPSTCRNFEVGCESCFSYRKYHNID